MMCDMNFSIQRSTEAYPKRLSRMEYYVFIEG
jgi:hypothetical protein